MRIIIFTSQSSELQGHLSASRWSSKLYCIR